MKRTILILGLFVFGAVFFQSCKDDSLTAEEAKAGIDNADKELKSLVMSFEDGDAYATFKKFTDYSKRKIAKETNNEEWMDTLLDKLEEVIDFDQMQSEFENENRFYFDRYLGIYTWDIENKKWNKESSDHIELIFPSEENLDSNDIKFTFSSYSDENIILEGESYWAPVSLHAKIEQNGTLLASIDLNNIDFDTDLFYLYKQIDISLFVNPIKINYFYDNRSPVNFYTSFDISDGVNTVGTVIDLYTLHELSEDFTEQDFKDVS
ncbi:MAG: hypothetical protein GXO50_06430, partial [Chlorobi bacterium]|nr:hypothetical protein [Chlorobiota bacterium]